jgi:hypothetical protein
MSFRSKWADVVTPALPVPRSGQILSEAEKSWPVYEIDPLQDHRWSTLVESHPRSSVFHTTQWLEALRRTYDYTPKAFTTSPPGTLLTNGIVFCQVDSWLTGPRLVSLPFSDHCDPLLRHVEDLNALLAEVRKKTSGKLRYTEIRPRSIEVGAQCGFRAHSQYYLHVLKLHASIEELHSRLHKNSIQRKIRRAQREHVLSDQGQSEEMLKEFYGLLVLTRRRHRLPPQPFAWFRNLVDCFGNLLTIRVARVNGQPIASILTLRHKQRIVYKYGCSDVRFHSLGGMPFLFWQAIQEAKLEQLRELDLGRSEPSNTGLIRFKDHLGAGRTSLSYARLSRKAHDGERGVQSQFVQRFLSLLPDNLFRLSGEIFYRHVG